MKNIAFVVFVLVQGAHIMCQTVEPSTGIDDEFLQIELESIYSIQKEGTEKNTAWSIPSLLVRYGLTSSIELQVNVPVVKEQLYNDDHLIHELYKFDDMQLGVSVNLWEQKQLVPEAALMYRIIIPANIQFNINNLGHILSLNLSHQIGSKFSFTNNIGFVDELNNKTTGFYISNLSYELNPKVHFFVENFGDFNSSKFISTNINIGGGYNINTYLSIDLSMARGINHDLFYVGGILTWVFNTR